MRRLALPFALLLALGACATPRPVPISADAGVVRPGEQIGAPQGPRGSAGISLGGSVPQTAPQRPRVQGPPAAQADAFARNYLDSIQARSFAQGIELCGYFYIDAAGRIAATPPVAGLLASCTQYAPGPEVFASYHTHGSFDYDYDNEVPSIGDLEGDFSFGIDGYISTPGGRVWRIEYDDRRAIQVCGLGCVAVDPGFVPRDEGGVRVSYSIPELRQR